MPRPSASDSPPSETASKTIPLRLGTNVLALLEEEAAALQLNAPGLLRALLRRKRGTQGLERSEHVRRPKPLPNKEPSRATFQPRLPGELVDFLDEISNRLGGADKATILMHLILDWPGISPLARDAVFRVETPAKAAGAKRPPVTKRHIASQTLKQQIFKVGTPLVALLAEEASFIGMRPSELVRDLLRAKGGLARMGRSPQAPVRRPLANVDHPRTGLGVLLPLDQVALLEELSNRLGGGTKATIISHLILDYMNISPLSLTYPFEAS